MVENKEKGLFEKQLVIFSIGTEKFGVDISEVREIIKLEGITKIPDTAEYIDGIINLRGRIIVIIDLAKKLVMKSNDRGKDTRIIVIESGDNAIGMVVDNCSEVIRLNTSQIEPAPKIVTKKINSDFLEGVGVMKEGLIMLLALHKVIDNLDEITTIINNTKEKSAIAVN